MNFFFRKLGCFLIGVCILCCTTLAQPFSVQISGIITDVSANDVQQCYIKISSQSDSIILAYLNTGQRANFSAIVKLDKPDSLILETSNAAYQSYKKAFYFFGPDSLFAKIVLIPQYKMLEQVVITAPPVWIRGDTTFFRADHFKEGDERNLKDLLVKMPGFELDENDNLLFKKKKVEKLLIDGEDIFSQRVKMLINNFPLHVINQIQALENQTNDPLLKGLKAEQRVFVNINLKRASSLHAFGSGEAGIGTAGRYLFKPVLFSLYRKLKMGYIGSVNSVGDGIKWSGEQELVIENTAELQPWLIKPQGLITLGNFQNNRYIINRQWNHNFQVNFPATQSVKNRLLASFFSDKQTQATHYHSLIYNDSVFVEQKDTNSVINKPGILLLQHILEWQTSAHSGFKWDIQLHHDFSRNNQLAKYGQLNQSSFASNAFRNKSWGGSFKTEFTKRISNKKGYKLSAFLSKNSIAQSAQSSSASFANIFAIAPYYDLLLQSPALLSNQALVGYELNTKRGSDLRQLKLTGSFHQIDFSRKFYFQSTSLGHIDTVFSNFSNKGIYKLYSANAGYQQAIRLDKLDVQLMPSMGYFAASAWNDNAASHFQYPVYSMLVSVKKSFSYKLKSIFKLSADQQAIDKHQVSNLMLPQSVLSYKQTLPGTKPLRFINGSVSLAHFALFPKHSFSNQLSISMIKNYRTAIATNRLYNFVQLSVDSFANRASNQLSVYSSSSINQLKSGALYTFGGGITWSKGFLNVNGEPMESRYLFAYYYLSAKANVMKKYFFEINGHHFFNRVNYPSHLSLSALKIPSVKLQLMQRLVFLKQLNFVFNTEYFNGNLNAAVGQSLFFADAELALNMPKKNMFISLKVENLANQKYYFTNESTFLGNKMYRLPIVKRNVFFSLRYNL